MANFRDQFEELFGGYDKYDPIKIAESGQQRALNIEAGVPEIDASGAGGGQLPMPPVRKAIDPGQGFFGNVGDLLKTGTALGGEAVVGAAEYGARQFAGDTGTVRSEVLSDVSGSLLDVRKKLEAYRQSIYDQMPQDAVEKKGAEFLTLDPSRTIWKGNPLDVGEAVLYKFIESVPMMVGTLLPGAVLMRAGASSTAITYLGASEAGLSVGFIANDITAGIMEMSDEQLAAESPRYVELLETMGTPEAARDQFVAEAQGLAPIIGGILVGAVAATAGRYLEPVITGKAGLSALQRAGRGAVSEGLAQEGPQETIEQVAQNFARLAFDGDMTLLEGTAEAYVQGAVVGAPGGAAIAALVGRRQEPTDPAAADPGAPDVPGAPFDEVFGPQAPPEGGYTGAPGDMFPGAETGVDPAIEAAIAANMRRDDQMGDMVDNLDQFEQGQANQDLDLQGGGMNAQGRDVATVSPQPPDFEGQGQLPLTQRQRGVPPQDVSGDPPVITPPPTQQQGTVPTEQQGDLFDPVPLGGVPQPVTPPSVRAGDIVPSQVEGYTVTMTDDAGNIIEEDIFETEEEANRVADALHADFPDANIVMRPSRSPAQRPDVLPDELDSPTAEPLADIQAQLADLANPESDREGVFLSADNLARMQADGVRDVIGDIGIHLVNFDDKGGLLIVKSEEVAQGVQELKEGAFPMQFIIGQLTRAGTFKPAGGVVVQLRDDAGNVVRESVVEDEQAAQALSEQMGDNAVVLTAEAAHARRERLIEAERKELTRVAAETEARRKSERAIEEELEPSQQEEAREAVAGAKTPSKASARLLGLAAKKAKKEEQQRIGGFFPPDSLEFTKQSDRLAYAKLFTELVDTELTLDLSKDTKATSKASQRRTEIFKELGRVRQAAKPTRVTERTVRAAAKTDVSTASALRAELSKKADKIDESAKDYFAGEEFELLTREQIDALSGTELTAAFNSAAYWLAGQYRNVEMKPEFMADLQETGMDEVVEAIEKAQGDPLAALTAAYNTPGKMKKLLRRTMVQYRRRKHGGKVKAMPLTKTAAKKRIAGDKGVYRAKSGFDTGVLTRDTGKPDESKSDMLKRKAAGNAARKKLSVAVRQAGKLMMRLQNTRSEFGRILAEKDPETGELTQAASDLLYGRSYFSAIAEFAVSLIDSKLDTLSAIQEMSRLDMFIRNAVKIKADKFGKKLAVLAAADAQESFLAKPVGTDAKLKSVKAIITDPTAREETRLEQNQKIAQHVASLARIEEVWKKNAFYKNLVGPVLHKLTQSVIGDGYVSYTPVLHEMQYIQHAMKGWRQEKGSETSTLYNDMYKPLKRLFGDLGFQFNKRGDLIIPLDEDGNYKYSPGDSALLPKYRRQFGTQTEEQHLAALGGEGRTLSVDEFNKQRTRQREQRAVDILASDEAADIQQYDTIAKANGAISRFLARVGNSKTTINGLINAEQRFIHAMKSLGVWRDTPSPLMGKIRLGVERTYRIVGPRLKDKKITKVAARRMMSGVKPVALPRDMRTDRRLELQEKSRTDDFFMDMVDRPADTEQLRTAAAELGTLLADRSQPRSSRLVLNTLIGTLPDNHTYSIVAKKLRALNMDDITVQFDWSGKIVTKGKAGRYINGKVYLNAAHISSVRAQGIDVSPLAIHAVLHEITHGATVNALATNAPLRHAMHMLRAEVASQVQGREGELTYGLKSFNEDGDPVPIDEFVVEAFTNPEFQKLLKQTKIGTDMSLWDRFVGIVKRLLGFLGPIESNAFDIIMSLESKLFEAAGKQTQAESASFDMEIDPAVQPIVSNVMDKLNQTTTGMKRIWDRVRPPLIAMTMEQIRDVYMQDFGGVTGPLSKYMRAFFQRNAENTRLMEAAEKITRKWTVLDEENAEAGTAFSELATEATMNEIAANKPITHDANEHLVSIKQKARHKQLHEKYNQMSGPRKKLYNDLQVYYRETLERETSLMTLNALRGLLTNGDKIQMTVAEFDAKYSLQSIKKFTEKEALVEEFGKFFEDDRRKDMLDTLHQMANLRQKRRGNYFPLNRYGDYVVFAEHKLETKVFDNSKDAYGFAAERRAEDVTLTVGVHKDDTGNFIVDVSEKDFRTAETPTKAAEKREEMISMYGADPVSTVQLKSKLSHEAAIQSNAALNSILRSLAGNTAAQAAMKQFYLESLSDSSFRKHEMKRKNRRGVETDLQLRNFTTYAKQSSYYSAQLMFGSKMAEGISDMTTYARAHRDETSITTLRLGEVIREIVKRDEMTADPGEIMKLVKRSVEFTQFMMLTSPSYWMINASQPWMVTLPWLSSQYGVGASLASLKNAQGLIISPLVRAMVDSKGGLSALKSKLKAERAFNVLDDVIDTLRERDPANADAYISMLEELRQNSVIDLSWIAELRDISEGTDTGMKQKVLDASRIMAHLTEVNNRILTAIATYDLAKQAAIDAGAEGDTIHKIAVKQAKLAVSQTQFNYSSPNKPRLFQSGGPLGKFGPAVFQFMQWPQHMYAMMIQNMHQSVKGGTPQQRAQARKLLLGLFGTHIAAGGILGAALQPVKWAAGLVMYAFGDDEDTLKGAVSGETFDRAITNTLTELFGSEIGGVLSKGLPMAVGADLSARMSLGTVYYLDFRGDNAESALGSLALGLGGASVNLVANMGRGVQQFFNGNYLRAIESASPKILRDVVRTGRYWNEGLVNNAGDTVISAEGIGPRDLFLQSMGISPSTVSQFYSAQSAIKDAERYYREKKSDLLRDFRIAAPEDRAAVVKAVAEFNRRNPAIAITRSALIQSVKGRAKRESRFRRYGANIDEKAAIQFAQEGLAYR